MDGPTPILAAVYRGNRDEVAAVLAGGAEPALFEAAALGDAARVRALAAADPAAVDRRSPDGWPPLHLAAHFGHGDAVDALLEAGADVRARSANREANTALHAGLAGRADLRIVTRLLARGSDVNASDGGGFTPLHTAAVRDDDVGMVNTLLAHGARADARAGDARTALAFAEARGHAEVARRLRGELP
jgi:ankyrin repeat protein